MWGDYVFEEEGDTPMHTMVSAEDKVEDSYNTFLTELNTEPCETTAKSEY